MRSPAFSLLFMFALMAQAAIAQSPPPEDLEGGPMRERVLEFKKEIFKEQLVLDDAQMEAFWAVYLRYDQQQLALKQKTEDLKKGIIAMNDEQLKGRLEQLVAVKEEELAAFKAYYQELQSVLSYRQMLALFDAEQDIKREIIRRLRERRMNQRGR